MLMFRFGNGWEFEKFVHYDGRWSRVSVHVPISRFSLSPVAETPFHTISLPAALSRPDESRLYGGDTPRAR